MKTCFLLFLVALGAIFFAYFAGIKIATERCKANVANDAAVKQSCIIKLQEDVNAEVLNRGVDDIRRVLYEKYTIAE